MLWYPQVDPSSSDTKASQQNYPLKSSHPENGSGMPEERSAVEVSLMWWNIVKKYMSEDIGIKCSFDNFMKCFP